MSNTDVLKVAAVLLFSYGPSPDLSRCLRTP